MKKIWLLALLTGWTIHPLLAQKLNDSLLNLNNEELANYYVMKSRSQKKAACAMAAGGLALGIIGAGISLSEFEINFYSDPQPSYSHAGEVIALIGAAAIVGSIPFFMAAGENKRRAKILLGSQSIPVTGSFHLHQPSIGLVIPIGK
jgi:hypothetical protein